MPFISGLSPRLLIVTPLSYLSGHRVILVPCGTSRQPGSTSLMLLY